MWESKEKERARRDQRNLREFGENLREFEEDPWSINKKFSNKATQHTGYCCGSNRK
jgi:hypothetical protein